MELSGTKRHICEYLLRYEKEQGYPPSVRETGAAMGLKSPATVHFHMKELEKAGIIHIESGRSRAISINYDKIPQDILVSVFPDGVQPSQSVFPDGMQSPQNAVSVSPDELQMPQNIPPVSVSYQIPVLKSISLKNNVPAGENITGNCTKISDCAEVDDCIKINDCTEIEEYLTFDPGDPQGKYFALRVREMSMSSEGILPGDLVVVRRQQNAQKGEIVVVWRNGRTEIKRFPEECFNGAEVPVLGKVTAVIRRYEP